MSLVTQSCGHVANVVANVVPNNICNNYGCIVRNAELSDVLASFYQLQSDAQHGVHDT